MVLMHESGEVQQGYQERVRGGPQHPWGLITLNASRFVAS